MYRHSVMQEEMPATQHQLRLNAVNLLEAMTGENYKSRASDATAIIYSSLVGLMLNTCNIS